MAKGSKKGACSAHVDAAKANCLKHDRREGKIPSYVNPHLTHTNRTVFEDEMIRGRKSITPLVNRAEKLYTEKTGQKCQKSFAPFREDVLRIKAGITDDQLLAFKDQVEKATGWKVVGIWLHQDEGHYHSKYIEGDENYAINYHAHVLYSCQDQETGKAIRLGRNYFRLRQDWLAEATGMERGNSAAETGIRHRSSQQQRIETQEERLGQLHDAALIEGIKGKFGLSSKDAKIRQEKGKNKALRQQLAEVPARIEAARAEGAAQAHTEADTEIGRIKSRMAAIEAERDDARASAAKAAQIANDAVEREKKEVLAAYNAGVQKGTADATAKIAQIERVRDNAINIATEAEGKAAEAVEREKKAKKLASIYDRLIRACPVLAKALAAIEQAASPNHSDVLEDDEEAVIYAAMGGDAATIEQRKEVGSALIQVAAANATDAAERRKMLAMEHWSMEPLAEQGAEARSRNNGYSR